MLRNCTAQVYGVIAKLSIARSCAECYVGLSNGLVSFLLQAMHEVGQRMQLRHPNIATVMGVATEPVTEDPLLVSSLLNSNGPITASQSKAAGAEMSV